MKKKMNTLLAVAGLVLALASASPAAIFTDNFDTPHNYLTDGLGAYDGLLDGDGTVIINALNTDPNRPGELYIQNDAPTGGWNGDSTGQLLYKEWTGDFVATVKVTDFAGTLNDRVFHNNCGILARDPASGPGTQNWVSMDYFPTWVGFIAWNNIDSVRTEHGQVAQYWAGDDTFAIAEANPWIQLERVGDDFHFRISADGVTFYPLTDPAYAGVPDGTQTPLVINRPDLPATLQIGLVQDGTSGEGDQAGGYAAFDNFSIVSAFDFDPTPAHGATVAVADPLTLSWLNLPETKNGTDSALVDVYWGTDEVGIGGTQVLTNAPDALTVDVTADVIGPYYWKIVATDPNTGGDDSYVMEEAVYSLTAVDGCDFAKNYAASPYTETMAREKGDTNYDCEVKLDDLAAMVLNWLENKSL